MAKYEVTYLIDVVSSNPEDYTIRETVEAESEVDAIKKVAISMTADWSSNIAWIQGIQGEVVDVMQELMECNYCFTNVIKL